MPVKRVIIKAFIRDVIKEVFLYETAFYFDRDLLLKYVQGSFRK